MRLLLVTQTLDAAHPALGFFVEWVEAFRRHPSVTDVQVVTTNRLGLRLRRLFGFWKAIASARCDVAVVHMTPLWVVLGWPLWKMRGTKTVLWYTHGSSSLVLRVAVRLADVTFTATQQAFPFVHPRVKAIGHGIASAYGAVSREERPTERLAFLAVGRIAPRKRVRETLALFAQIRRLEPRATLTWVGAFQSAHDPYAVKVMEDLHRLGIRDAVQMGASVPAAQMPAVYAAHDALLHLSDTGSLDKVVLEALAAGCPVFSTNAATAEGVGEAWIWRGRLDATAAEEAVRRLRAGVSPQERQRVAAGFALDPFIHRFLSSV